jgi:signal transduction histidine kinase
MRPVELPFRGGTRGQTRTLTRDILVAYLVLALLVGVSISYASMWLVNGLETHLQRIDMGMAIERIHDEFVAGKDVKRADRFFHGQPESSSFPTWLRGVQPGFSRLEHDGRAWHVITSDYGSERFMLLRDYTAFEAKRLKNHWLAVAGVSVSMLVAFLLGAVTMRRLVRPLVGLTEQVGQRDTLPPQTRLAHAYPGNEIGRLATAFDETYNRLEAALQREKFFTADVSHELRTPLTVISSSCELLLEDPSLTATQQAKLQRVLAASGDIQQQLAAYLMLARGSSDATGFAKDFAASIAQMEIEHWAPRAKKLGLEIRHDFEKTPVETTAPTVPIALLRIVLSNLIRNALQHASGATVITVRTRTHRIEVEDNGAGVSLDAASNAFSPFTRGATSNADNLGLGLSLVQRICEHQGWAVTYASSTACTRFSIDLRR